MDIRETSTELAEKGQQAVDGVVGCARAALDVDGDGKVSFDDVVNAGAGRIIETKDAVVAAAREVHDALDIDGDGKVTLDEVGSVVRGAAAVTGEAVGEAAEKAKDAFGDLADRAKERLAGGR